MGTEHRNRRQRRRKDADGHFDAEGPLPVDAFFSQERGLRERKLDHHDEADPVDHLRYLEQRGGPY